MAAEDLIDDTEGRDLIDDFLKRQKPLLEDLTARQKEILSIISSHMVREGVSPSLREIGRDAGIASLNGVVDHLKALIRKGWLRNSGKGRARGYVLSAAATGIVPGVSKNVNHITLRKLNDFIRDFPDNVLADLASCETPQDGALLIVNLVDDILSGNY